MPDHETLSTEDRRFEHLESLHRLAQVVTPSAEQAARLVAATYRHASALPLEAKPPLHDRLWLLRLMMQVRREENFGLDAEAAPPDASPPGGDAVSDFRRRAAAHLLSQKLPAAFASLSAEGRALLILCGVERLSCADAGAVLGLSVDAACARLDRAWTDLRRDLRAGTSEAERRLLDIALLGDGLRRALERLIAADFAAPSAALKAAVAAAAREAQPDRPPEKDRARVPLVPATRAGDGATLPASFLPSRPLQRAFVVLLIIGVAGLVGYLTSSLLQVTPTTDLMALSAQQAEDARATLRTGRPADAERFIREQLDQRLSVPTIEGASLQGVSIMEVAPAVQVPVLLFADAAGQPIALYAYTYALLDRHGDRLHLDAAVLRHLENAGRIATYDRDDRAVLVWRDRDDIFVAVASGDPAALRRRLSS